MPNITVSNDVSLHYVVDDFSDPWQQSEAILLLHGAAESSEAWFGWVPQLSKKYHVVRPDMRGFGKSTPMPRHYPWSLDRIVDDYVELMDKLDIDRFHLIGAKLGGTVARHFAATHPERLRTLTLVGVPKPRRTDQTATIAANVAKLDAGGTVKEWARPTMKGRLGSSFPDEGAEWWITMMARTQNPTLAGFLSNI